MAIARSQTLVQLTDALVAALDERAARVRRSRSDLIREAVERYLADVVEGEVDRQIVDGYRRHPPEDVWGDDAAAELIREEPW